MTHFNKRHYEAIARVMQIAHPGTEPGANNEERRRQWIKTLNCLTELFCADNGAFQLGRFERACEPGANVRARKAS